VNTPADVRATSSGGHRCAGRVSPNINAAASENPSTRRRRWSRARSERRYRRCWRAMRGPEASKAKRAAPAFLPRPATATRQEAGQIQCEQRPAISPSGLCRQKDWDKRVGGEVDRVDAAEKPTPTARPGPGASQEAISRGGNRLRGWAMRSGASGSDERDEAIATTCRRAQTPAAARRAADSRES